MRKFTILLFAAIMCSMSFGQIKLSTTNNVGIGMTPTTKKLDVGGDIGTTGYFYGKGLGLTHVATADYGIASIVNVNRNLTKAFVVTNTAMSGQETFLINGNGDFYSKGYFFGKALELTPGSGSYNYAFIVKAVSTTTKSIVVSNNVYAPSAPEIFVVYGNGDTYTRTLTLTGSDISFKKNITPIENSLNKVLNLKGVRFQYKNETEASGNVEEDFQLGFIAQEVEEIFPELVKTMENGTKAMAYSNLTAVLVEAIKEQQQFIETQKIEIESLKHKVELLQQKIENILNLLNSSQPGTTE